MPESTNIIRNSPDIGQENRYIPPPAKPWNTGHWPFYLKFTGHLPWKIAISRTPANPVAHTPCGGSDRVTWDRVSSPWVGPICIFRPPLIKFPVPVTYWRGSPELYQLCQAIRHKVGAKMESYDHFEMMKWWSYFRLGERSIFRTILSHRDAEGHVRSH
jgi:hypothetical protein